MAGGQHAIGFVFVSASIGHGNDSDVVDFTQCGQASGLDRGVIEIGFLAVEIVGAGFASIPAGGEPRGQARVDVATQRRHQLGGQKSGHGIGGAGRIVIEIYDRVFVFRIVAL